MIISNMSVKLAAAAVIAAGLLAAGPAAYATPITVPNASFETPSVGGTAGAFGGSDWLTNGAAGLLGTTYANPTDGVQTAFVGTGPGSTAIYQDIGALQPNTLYTLTVDVVSRHDGGSDFPFSEGALALYQGTSHTPLGTLKAETTGFFQPAVNTAAFSESVQYATGASVSGDLTIALFKMDHAGDPTGTQVLYDNVRLTGTSTVPEPGSLVLMVLGTLGFAYFARRRRTN
jgi:hapalindole biogenesis HpiC1 cyclase-like protein/PEP-CTERM motif-containing protein